MARSDTERLENGKSFACLLCGDRLKCTEADSSVYMTTGESGGLHVEGIHQVSIVLSSSAIVAIVVLIIAWCLLRGKKNCCKKNETDSSVRIQIPSAPQFLPAMIPPPQPTTAPPTDRELAQFLHLRQEQQRLQNQLDAMTPGRQLAIMQTPTT